MAEKNPGTRTRDELVNPQAVGRNRTEATIRERAARGTDLEADEVALSGEGDGGIQTRITDTARRERAAEQSERYSAEDLQVQNGEVAVREQARKREAAAGTPFDPDELRVTEDGVEPKDDPAPEATRVILTDDDPRGELTWVGPDGQRIETGVEAGGGIYSAYVDVPDREGTWRLEAGGEPVDRVDVGPVAASRDRPQQDVALGWNGNVIELDEEAGTGSLTQDEVDDPGQRRAPASADEDVVAGEGAADALQAGATPEQLSPYSPISEGDADQIEQALDEQGQAPAAPADIGEGLSDQQLATRGSDANRRLRERIASEQDGLTAEQVDLVATEDGLAFQRDGETIGTEELDFGSNDPGAPAAAAATEPLDEQLRDGDGEITRTGDQPASTGEVRAAVNQFGQQQLEDQRAPSTGEVRASVNRFGQQQLENVRAAESGTDSRPPLIEPDDNFSAGEVLTGQAAAQDPQFKEALINDALGTVGVEDELGFREPTRGQADPVPDDGDSPLRFARGAGPRRQFRVESETAGDAITDAVSDPRAQAAAAAGVAAPEPATTLGGAAVLATAGVAAAATQEQDRDVSASPFTEEVDVPDEQQRSELEAPEDSAVREVEVPDRQQTVSPSELGVPQEAFEPDNTGEVPVDVSGGAEINEDGEVELPAEASGVVVYRNRDEEEEDEADEDDGGAEDEENEGAEEDEVAVEVPDELLNNEEQTIGGEPVSEDPEQQAVEPQELQEQEELEPKEEQTQITRTPRQGQQSDAVGPELTRSDGEQPLSESAEEPRVDAQDTTNTGIQSSAGIELGSPQDVTGVAGGTDGDEATSVPPQSEVVPFSGTEGIEDAGIGSVPRPDSISRAGVDVDTAMDADAGLSAPDVASPQTTAQSPVQQSPEFGQPQTPADQTLTPEQVFNQPRINEPTSRSRPPRPRGFDPSGPEDDEPFSISEDSALFDSEIVGDPFETSGEFGAEAALGAQGAEDGDELFDLDEDGFSTGDGFGDVDVGDSDRLFDLDS